MTRGPRRATAACAALLLASALPGLAAPARVRLTLADGSTLEGELLRHLGGEYRVRVGGEERALAEGEVRAAEVLEEDRALVDVEARARPLGELAEGLAGAAGRTVRVSPGSAGFPVTLGLRQVGWPDALRTIARLAGCELEREGVAFRIRPLVTLSARDLPAQVVVVRAGAAAEQRIEVDRGVAGRVCAELDQVPLRSALDALSWALALEVDRRADPWKVTRQAERPPFVAWGGPRWGVGDELPQGEPVTLELTGRSLQEVCEAIAAAAGVRLLVHPEVPPLSVDLRVRGASWRDALAEVLRLSGCRVETVAGMALVTRPRGVVRALRAPPGPLLALLAGAAGRGVIVAPEVRGLLGFEMHGVEPREALHRVAHSVGWQVVLVDDQVFAVGGPRLDPEVPPDPPVPEEGRLTLGGKTLPRPRFQALLVGCGRDRVLLDGRAYGEGDELLEPGGAGSGVRLERIGGDGVDLVAGEERQRLPFGR